VADASAAAPTADGPTAGLAARQFADATTIVPRREAPTSTGTLHGPSDAVAGDPPAPTVAPGSAVSPVGSTDAAGATTSDADGLDVPGLTASISRPLAEGNGEYSVAVSLHPPQLGEVRALLSLRGDTLEVTLTPEMAAGHEALGRALPALRDQLAADGLRVNVSLGDPRGQSSDREPTGGSAAGPGPNRGMPDLQASDHTPPSTADDGRIHLVL
jgi:hypothetical protein